MTCKDPKASLGNEERLDVYFYGPREENPIYVRTTRCKQVSYCVSVMSTIVSISISIFTIDGLREIPYVDYQDCFSPRNTDSHIDLTLDVQPIFKTPIIWPPTELKELKIQWMSSKGFIWPSVSSWGTLGLYEEERQNLMVVYYVQKVAQGHCQNKCPIPCTNYLWN